MYGKVFASLYQGTLRGKAHPILVFNNLIATANRHGEVDRHWRAIAEDVGLTTEEVRDAIDFLSSPDPESRSPDCDGARLTLIAPPRAWGWVIVNYAKYRDIRDEETRRDSNRAAAEKYRAKKSSSEIITRHQSSSPVISVINNHQSSSPVISVINNHQRHQESANAEAEAEAEVREREEDSSLSAAKKESDPSQTERRLRSWTCRISETSPIEAWGRLADAHGWGRLDVAISSLPAKDRWADRVEESILAAIQVEKERALRAQARQAKASEVPTEAKARESPEEGRFRRLAGNLNTLERMQVGRWHVASNGDWLPGPGADPVDDTVDDTVSKQQTNEGQNG
jgi:hypothetical protein